MERNIQQSSFEQLAVNKRSKDEMMQMTATYNLLMAQLEELHDKQQQFIGNASHELKTPLTVIESYAKLLKRRGTENVAVTEEAAGYHSRKREYEASNRTNAHTC